MTIAAEYHYISAKTKRENPGKIAKLSITRIENGKREILTAFYVEGRIHARRLALSYNATPWNF